MWPELSFIRSMDPVSNAGLVCVLPNFKQHRLILANPADLASGQHLSPYVSTLHFSSTCSQRKLEEWPTSDYPIVLFLQHGDDQHEFVPKLLSAAHAILWVVRN
jgi:hypothetical protein